MICRGCLIGSWVADRRITAFAEKLPTVNYKTATTHCPSFNAHIAVSLVRTNPNISRQSTANAKYAKFRCETPRTLRTPRLQFPRTFSASSLAAEVRFEVFTSFEQTARKLLSPNTNSKASNRWRIISRFPVSCPCLSKRKERWNGPAPWKGFIKICHILH